MLNKRYGSPDWGHVLQLLWIPASPADDVSSNENKTPPPAEGESRRPTPPVSQLYLPEEHHAATLEGMEHLEAEMDDVEVAESITPKSNGKRKQGELTSDEDGTDHEPVKVKKLKGKGKQRE